MSTEFNPYYVFLGIPPSDLAMDHYRLLGLVPLESDLDIIAMAADRQMSHLKHYEAGQHADDVTRLMSEVSRARLCLLDPKKKAHYDQQLQAAQEQLNAAVEETLTLPEDLSPPPPRTLAPQSASAVDEGDIIDAFVVPRTEPPSLPPAVASPPSRLPESQTVDVARLNLAEVALAKEITNTIGMKLTLIPAGEFLMGSATTETNRGGGETQHRVQITKPFYLGTTEVTQGQWESVMGTTPWRDKSCVKEGDDYPATHVSWNDAVEFCRRLSVKERRKYRLPTEAEWEYACRAGSTTAYSFGDSAASLKDYAWFDENASKVGERYPHRVGQKGSNAFGLYDMHGNVFEWCQDWYDRTFYATAAAKEPNPVNASRASRRVMRGGSWGVPAEFCRAAYRRGYVPEYRYVSYGFRLAAVPSSRASSRRQKRS